MSEQRTSKKRTCPNGCGPLEPHTSADIGVGVQDFGPWGCPACHYIEEDDRPILPAMCAQKMGRAQCNKAAEHEGPHEFEESFL